QAVGGHRIATPPPQPQQRAPKPPDQGKAPPQAGPRKIGNITPEMLAGLEGRGSNISVREIEDRMRRHQQTAGPATPTTGPVAYVEEAEGDDESAKKKKGGPRRSTTGDGGVPGRAERHKERSERQAKRKGGEE